MAGAVALLPALLAAKPAAAETVAIEPVEDIRWFMVDGEWQTWVYTDDGAEMLLGWGENRWEGGSLAIVGESDPAWPVVYNDDWFEQESVRLITEPSLLYVSVTN